MGPGVLVPDGEVGGVERFYFKNKAGNLCWRFVRASFWLGSERSQLE